VKYKERFEIPVEKTARFATEKAPAFVARGEMEFHKIAVSLYSW
jgi:hypothetical protein